MKTTLLTVDQLNTLAAYGGGFRVSATRFTADQLNTLAAYARSGNAKIVVADIDLLTVAQMNTIASYGKGAVFFEG